MTHTAVLSLGSNWGDREKAVSDALSLIQRQLGETVHSDIYFTPAVNGKGPDSSPNRWKPKPDVLPSDANVEKCRSTSTLSSSTAMCCVPLILHANTSIEDYYKYHNKQNIQPINYK